MIKKIVVTIMAGVFATGFSVATLYGDVKAKPDHRTSPFHDAKVAILKSILKQNIPRQFDFRAADLSVFTGINLHIDNLRISENPDFINHPLKQYTHFYTDGHTRVNVKVWPLFLARVYMKDLQIDKPVIHVIRNRQGNLSIDDMFRSSKKSVLDWLNVDNLHIEDGTLHYIDAAPPGGTFEIALNSLNASVTGFSINHDFNVAMSLRGPQAASSNLHITGRAGPIKSASNFRELPMDVRFRIEKTPVSPYAVYIPKGLPVPINGEMSVNYHVHGTAWSGLFMKGDSRIDGIVLRSENQNRQSIPFDLGLFIDDQALFSLKEDRLAFSGTRLQLNASPFFIDGEIARLSQSPQMDLRIVSPGIDLDDIKRIHPFYEDYLPDHLSCMGLAGMNIHASGDQSKVHITGEMDFTHAALSVQGFFAKKQAERHVMTFEATTFPETRTFEGSGRIAVGRIEVVSPDFFRRFLNILSHMVPDGDLNTLDAGDDETPVIADSLEGEVRFTDAQLFFSQLLITNCRRKIEAHGLDAVMAGEVDLTQNTILAKGRVILPVEISRKIDLSSPFAKNLAVDDSGRLQIPVTISGPMNAPSFRVNEKNMDI